MHESRPNKTDTVNGSHGIRRVIDASRSPSPDPESSATSRTRMENSHDDLHWAAERGDIAAVKAFLAAGHDPNAFDDISFTPLHYAAREEHLYIIRLLLEAGADVNAHDEPRIGDTPLGCIAGNCSIAVAQALLAAGANPTIRGWMQLCALDRAKDRKKDEGPKVYELLCNASRKFTVA